MAANKKDENPSRRKFIKNTVLTGVGFSLKPFHRYASSMNEVAIESLNLSERTKKLMTLFDIKYPIFQAAPGGELLGIAVANAGAMGAIYLTNTSPEEAFQKISRMKAATKGNFYANYILHFEPKSLDKALEAGVTTVQFSWGIPDKTMVTKVRAAKAKLGIQVVSKENAKAALDLQPDFLICQGVEAGGHVQANEPLYNLLHEIIHEAKDIPVLAAGGIATGHDIRKSLNNGASGVVIGTRFLATKEGEAHIEYKQSLVDAGENSTVFTICFDGGWKAMHRVLKNKTFKMWQAAGCPLPGSRPGEDDIVATTEKGVTIKRYANNSPRHFHKGSLNEMALYAGEGVNDIKDIPSANDLVHRLWKEYQNSK